MFARLLLCMLAFAFGAHQAGATDVRVGLASALSGVTLTGHAFGCATDPATAATLPDANRLHGPVVIAPTATGFTIGQQAITAPALWCHATHGTFSLAGRQLPPLVQITRDAIPQLTVVAPIPLEVYLAGVVGAEMPASWPAEALRAQAIIARTYTLAKIRSAARDAQFDLTADTRDQMYSAKPPDPRVQAAIDATRGQTLTDTHGVPFTPHYHSCCGGQTTAAQSIWPDASPLEQAVVDRACQRCPSATWTLPLSRDALTAALRTHGHAITPPLRSLSGSGTRADPRHTSLTITHGGAPLVLPANTFRQVLGYEHIKSAWFTIRPTRTGWTLHGRGFGHGAGLCQWGAKALAEHGKQAADILAHYYPGTRVTSIPETTP